MTKNNVDANRYPPVDQLTPRESSIWSLKQEGKTIKEIADILGLKSTSVSRYMATIKEKVILQ